MKNIRTKRGFKVIMALMGLFTIYGALFFYGGNQGTCTSQRSLKVRVNRRKDTGLDRYRHLILEASQRHQVPPALVAAIMHAESNFNPRAVSPVGARGLMQINGITQRHLGVRNVFSPKENVNGGARYLKELLGTFRGNKRLTIAAYNAGPGAVRKFRGVPPYKETRRYVVKVMKLYSAYKRSLPTGMMLAKNQ
jgi:soluble lytic murein transglycosylase-like protein